MTHLQHPIGTGFTAGSTANDILKNVDLTGTNAVVTAGHTGIGLEVTRALAGAGASVMIGARAPDRATLAVEGIEQVEVVSLDLLDPDSIESFASHYLASGRPLHILVNNAGRAGAPQERVLDSRGYEAQFATNHLGHFQLTLGLLPALRAAHGARVVTVSSGAQRFSDIRWDDPHFATTGYDRMIAYAQSKTANVLFSVELDRRWADDGVRGYAVNPGIVASTALNSSLNPEERRAMGLIDEFGRAIIDPESGRKTPSQGAATVVFAATSPLLAGIGGVYLNDNDISPSDDRPESTSADVMSHSIDGISARRLWEMSEAMIRT